MATSHGYAFVFDIYDGGIFAIICRALLVGCGIEYGFGGRVVERVIDYVAVYGLMGGQDLGLAEYGDGLIWYAEFGSVISVYASSSIMKP